MQMFCCHNSVSLVSCYSCLQDRVAASCTVNHALRSAGGQIGVFYRHSSAYGVFSVSVDQDA